GEGRQHRRDSGGGDARRSRWQALHESQAVRSGIVRRQTRAARTEAAARIPERHADPLAHRSRAEDSGAGDVRRRVQLLLLIVLLIAADQLTKSMARATLASESPRRFGILTLIYATNAGAFLSIGSNLPPELRAAIFSGIVTIALGIAALALFQGK